MPLAYVKIDHQNTNNSTIQTQLYYGLSKKDYGVDLHRYNGVMLETLTVGET
jgi:hypothetical protein